MSILSGQLIMPGMVEPFNEEDRQPASYDIHLGRTLLAYPSGVLDLRQPSTLKTQPALFPPYGRLLQPGQLYLGQSEEKLACGEFAVQIIALSSLMRVGLQVGQGSWADPGFKGHLTLELSTLSSHPIRLYPGMRIAQLVFHRVEGEIQAYKGRYQNQEGAAGAVPERGYEASPIRPHHPGELGL